MTNPNEYKFEDYSLLFHRGKYRYGLNTALYAYCSNGEPYGSISVNFDDVKLPSNQIFLDTNNTKDLCVQLIEDGLLELTGLEKPSGYCVYPVAKITKKFEKIITDF